VQSALQESEQRYLTIGELGTGVWTCAPDGRLTYLSEGFLEMAGCSWEECEGYQWLAMIGVDEVEELLTQWRQCAASGETWKHRFSIADKLGETRKILARGVPVRDREGEITSWVGVNLDLTDL